MKDADWYEDPLGRFEGRFFDGEHWTDRVSVDGAETIDVDFPPPSGADPARAQTLVGEAIQTPRQTSEFDEHSPQPAVATIRPTEQRRASLIDESPVRAVAVLDDSVVGSPTREPSPSRLYLAWGLLGLVGVLAIVGLLLWRSGDTPDPAVAQAVELDDDQEQRVQDLESGGIDPDAETTEMQELEVDAPTGAVEPGTVFAADELVEVGSLRVLNGASMLQGLEQWHTGFAADRGIELGLGSGCWFGQLGGAAVQVAQCGPVGGSAEEEFLFDLVPLVFEDVDGGEIAQPIVDAVTTDSVLANALTLIGSSQTAAPPLSLEGATRGDRETSQPEDD